MVREVVILASCGSVSYAWLCAVAAPLVCSIRSVWRGARRGAWSALALASAATVLWTVISAAAIVLGMILEPGAGLALMGSRLFWPGIWIGNLTWGLQLVLTSRIPRFGPTFEGATAVAIVALVNDEPRTLARVHEMYAAHAIAGDGVPAASVSPPVRDRGLRGAARPAAAG